MSGRRPAPWLRVVRRLASPTLLVTLAGAAMLVGVLRETARVVLQAGEVHLAASEARLAIAAETALAGFVAGGGSEGVGVSEVEIAGVEVSLRCEDGSYLIRCDHAGMRREYSAQQLSGGAPAALGLRRAVRDQAVLGRFGGGQSCSVTAMPRLDEQCLATAMLASPLAGFHRDPGIALQRLPVGTDRDDFVWRDLGPMPGREPGRDGLVVVPGHLWIEPGDAPLRMWLAGDLVVVVQGNIYLNRSLEVRGPGRLLLVATTCVGGVAFADEDGNGRWSTGDRLLSGSRFAGPMEGSGSVYLAAGNGSHAPLTCDAGMVVAGQLHVAIDVDVRGPLVLANGVTDLATTDRSWRLGRGQWTFRPGRERIQGFLTSGAPRPGLLQSILRKPLYPD